jgi:hypothetical protein
MLEEIESSTAVLSTAQCLELDVLQDLRLLTAGTKTEKCRWQCWFEAERLDVRPCLKEQTRALLCCSTATCLELDILENLLTAGTKPETVQVALQVATRQRMCSCKKSDSKHADAASLGNAFDHVPRSA